ncbi:MAG: hypothetical protein IBX67_03810 [Dehalococcoidia bacterium]|nr:hypothetical protein [Dehalococcoidia bacterium]
MLKLAKVLALPVAAVLLVLALRGPVLALLGEPLVQLWRLVNSVPQQFIWGLLAVLGFIVAFSLGRGPRRERREPAPLYSHSRTQIERLTQLILLGETSLWARDVLGRRLRGTAAGLCALREGIDLDQAREEVRVGRWPGHPRVAAVLPPESKLEAINNQGYADALAHALNALERYARGGTPEPN